MTTAAIAAPAAETDDRTALLTSLEVARLLGVSKVAVNAYRASGRLRPALSTRLGHLYDAAAVAALARRRREARRGALRVERTR